MNDKNGTDRSWRTKLRSRILPRLSIGFRFVSLVLLVALLSGGIVSFIHIAISRDALRQEILNKNLAQAELVAEFVSLYMEAVQAHIRVFADRPDVRQAILSGTAEQLQTPLANFVATQTALEGVESYDINGIQLANSYADATFVGQSFADRKWFQRVMATGQPYQSTPVKSKLTGNLLLPYPVPILDEQGQILGVLSGGISLSILSEHIVNIDLGSDTRGGAIDLRDGGIIIAQPNMERVGTPISGDNEAVNRLVAGERGAIELTTYSGEIALVAFAQVPDLPWGILVVTPRARALAVIDTLTRNVLLSSGIVILLAGVFGVIITIGVTRPLRRLVEATENIGHGNLEYEVTTAGKDEIGDLSRAFEQMTKNLRETLVSRDILAKEVAERKRAEEEREKIQGQLLQAQKMESVGRLAGGVAHDFNNLLTTIIGYSEIISKEEDLNDTTEESVQEIRKSADRATALTQQLLAFSRKQIMQPRQININELILNAKKMLTRLIRENIIFDTILCSEIRLITADPGQMEQVIMNLGVNASDAMPGGGTFTIKTKNVYLDKSYQQEHPEVVPGHYVEIELSDTGYGMDEKTKGQIFEPFFTTKEVGKGTGLGLATVYGMVRQNEGYILVQSEPGRGSTFKMYFPAVRETEEQQVKLPERQGIVGGNETILLVEDEEQLRKLSRKILEGFGYSVVDASNGIEALTAIERSGYSMIDCLVTDMIMPEMGGAELSNKLLETFPSVKILFVSGYTEDSISHDGVIDEGISFLQKPFTPQKLAAKIREILDET